MKCPNCKQELKNEDVKSEPRYHNSLVFICQKCGYEGDHTEF